MGNRGDGIGKQFTRLKTGLDFGGDKALHSIRHSFGTILRSTKGVEEHLVAALMGHRLTSETFGNYGKRGGRKLLPGTLAKLKYQKPL